MSSKKLFIFLSAFFPSLISLFSFSLFFLAKPKLFFFSPLFIPNLLFTTLLFIFGLLLAFILFKLLLLGPWGKVAFLWGTAPPLLYELVFSFNLSAYLKVLIV